MSKHDRQGAKEILVKARELISNPLNWTKHEIAATPEGRSVLAEHPRATRFCSIGAVIRASSISGQPREAGQAAHQALIDECYRSRAMGLSTFNDLPGTTHEQVLDLFDRTIERLK